MSLGSVLCKSRVTAQTIASIMVYALLENVTATMVQSRLTAKGTTVQATVVLMVSAKITNVNVMMAGLEKVAAKWP